MKRKLECEENKENKEENNIENKIFECGICEKTYKNKSDLNKHVLSHSTFFTCDLCGAKFRRKDVIIRHIQRKHNQKGGRIPEKSKNIPYTSASLPSSSSHTGRQQTSVSDHNYTTSLPSNSINLQSDENGDHNYAVPALSADHDLTTTNGHNRLVSPQLPTSGENQPITDLPTGTQHNYAIIRNIQDFSIEPNNDEQYDLLTFFANVKQKVLNILALRAQNNLIKWNMSVQVELIKDGQDGDMISTPFFRSRTYILLNLETMTEEDLIESFQKMFESFEKYIRESSGWVLKKVLKIIIQTVNYSPVKGSSYKELPNALRYSQSLLNIKHMDQKCFYGVV